MDEFITLDLSALLATLIVALACALLGNYLLLKKESLLGDSISHSILPGIVIAYMVGGSRSIIPVFIGSMLAGILSSIFIWLLVRFGRTEPSSAMGVVFSIFFALGVVLIESASLSGIDLDPDCLLHGQVETIFWLPNSGVEISVLNALNNLPLEVVSSFIVLLFVVFSVVLFWKELSLLCFDRGLCQSQGFKPIFLELFLLILVSVAVVASFKIVGSILVVALLVVPPACARLLTNSLRLQFLYSLVFAMLGVIIGYGLATRANLIFNINGALNVAGSVATVLGLMFILVSLLAPIYGIIPRLCRNYLQRIRTLKEDILGLLYRSEEGGKGELPLELFLAKLYSRFTSRLALFSLVRDGRVAFSGAYRLTEKGRDQAKELVRSHRLWEVFLSSNIGLDADHVHSTAENLEHIRSPILEKELEKISKDSEFDPHGKPIPKN